MKSHLWEAAVSSSICTQVCHPIPLLLPSWFCKEYSAVSMLLRNTLGSLNKCFLTVAGCIICYPSCISRSATKQPFLTQTGVIVRSPERWVGEYTTQKPLANCCWGCEYGWAGVWWCPSAILSGCSHTQHQAAPMEQVPPGSSARAPGGCACPEVKKHSASHRCETNDF